MQNDPKEDEIPLGIWCDLLEKELKTALDDLAKIRKAKSPSAKKDSAQCSGPLLAMLATT
jgi:hypothetical protein